MTAGTKGPGKTKRLAASARPRGGPHAAAATKPSPAWPQDLGGFGYVKNLGGSTGAKLVEDASGRRYVMKRGADPGHLLEEAACDDAYRALGVAVPESRIYSDAEGRPVKVARFVGGKTLAGLEAAGAAGGAKEQLRRDFAADALLGNWDVTGLEHDNVIVGEDDGVAYRIDNGGSLRRRAMGAPKPSSAFGAAVTELHSMRNPNRQTGKVFGGLTDDEVAGQVRDRILPARDRLLEAVPVPLRSILAARLEHLRSWAEARP
jgi:hypothetical protein